MRPLDVSHMRSKLAKDTDAVEGVFVLPVLWACNQAMPDVRREWRQCFQIAKKGLIIRKKEMRKAKHVATSQVTVIPENSHTFLLQR